MTLIPRVATVMQLLFESVANHLGKTSQFIKRERKLNGEKFAEILVFTWLNNPEATYHEMAQTAKSIGIKISEQAIAKRFTKESATFIYNLLSSAVLQVIEADRCEIPIFSRFASVIFSDSTTINLPDSLSQIWKGCCGGQKREKAAMKVQTDLDLSRGRLIVECREGKASDNTAAIQQSTLPLATLRCSDLGYFCLDVFARLAEAGCFFLSRLKLSASVLTLDENEIDLGQLLSMTQADVLDIDLLLGKKHQLLSRLIAHRVSEVTANLRRRQIRAEAKRKGLTPSKKRLATADWTILVTNACDDMLSADEALTVIRMRWQIELVFKLWKSVNRVDKWRSEKPWRVLTEVYTKLLIALLQHWLIIMGAWNIASRSFVKASKTILSFALMLGVAVAKREMSQLVSILHLLANCLCDCQIDKRSRAPSAFQLLYSHYDPAEFETPQSPVTSTIFTLS